MGVNGDLWIAGGYYKSPFIPINPHSDLWVKINLHKSQFPINPTNPEYINPANYLQLFTLICIVCVIKLNLAGGIVSQARDDNIWTFWISNFYGFIRIYYGYTCIAYFVIRNKDLYRFIIGLWVPKKSV